MKPEFHKTVNVLVQAYLNDTLVHRHPCGCAGGNIIAATKGYKVLPISERNAVWIGDNVEDGFDWFAAICSGYDRGNTENGVRQIEHAGYTVSEFRLIENAFERAYFDNNQHVSPETVFEGLMNVIDVLADIHSVDLTVREEAKLLFAKP